MTVINPAVTKEQVIPFVESEIFADHETSRFAIGVVAENDVAVSGLGSVYAGYYDLRKKVYVDRTGQLSPDDLHEDGTDRDKDDARSIAFSVVENLGGQQQRVVGTARLITKGFGSRFADLDLDSLPVEEEWAEEFSTPVPQGGFEVSRMISQHEKPALEDLNSSMLYAAMLAQVRKHDLGPGFAIVENWYYRRLKGSIPNREIGSAHFVEHYQDYNHAIQIDLGATATAMEQRNPGLVDSLQLPVGTFAYYGRAPQAPILRPDVAA